MFAGVRGQPGSMLVQEVPSKLPLTGSASRRSRSLTFSGSGRQLPNAKSVQTSSKLTGIASRRRSVDTVHRAHTVESLTYPSHTESKDATAVDLYGEVLYPLPGLEHRDVSWEGKTLNTDHSASFGSESITEEVCQLADHAADKSSPSSRTGILSGENRDQNGASVSSMDASYPSSSPFNLIEKFLRGFRRLVETSLRSLVRAVQQIARVLSAALVGVVSKKTVAFGPQLEGNWGPVREYQGGQEVGPLDVSVGALPADFPSGTYIRNGPNPYFRPQTLESVFGKVGWHFFEGDGMLHAVRLEDGQVFYRNKFVDTPALKMEKESGKALFWSNLEADPAACLAGFLVNFLRTGSPIKETANTSVAHHSGRTFALNEAGLPIEVNLSDLSTLGPVNFKGKLKSRFTAHPKIDATTGEMIFFGYGVLPPHCTIGVLSKEGNLIHSASLDIGRATLMHDFAITEKYTIILDFPLTISPWRVVGGGELVDFDGRGRARVGVLPRFGDGKSVRWFAVETGIVMHTMNGFEDGDEVVLHAFKQKSPLLKPPPGQTWKDFMPEALAPLHSDSTLLNTLHEWRFNLRDGSVRERQLAGADFLCDFPRINEKYTGRRYRYGYGAVCNTEATTESGLPYIGAIAKFQIPQSSTDPLLTPTFHNFKKGEFGGEAVFVARDGGEMEDDGWLVLLVHNVELDCSYFYVIDARDMEGEPVAKITLPQRVPWGLHGLFVPSN